MAVRKSKKWETNPFLPMLLKDSESKVKKVSSPLNLMVKHYSALNI